MKISVRMKVKYGYSYIFFIIEIEAYSDTKDLTIHRKHFYPPNLRFYPEQWAPGVDKAGVKYWVTDEEGNKAIRNILDQLDRIYVKMKLLRGGVEPYAREIVKAFRAGDEKIRKERLTLTQFIPQYVIDNKVEGALIYNNSLVKALESFMKLKLGKQDIFLDEIDTAFLYRFEMYLNHALTRYGKPYKPATSIKYIEKLIAVIHYAHRTGEIKTDPLAQYTMGTIITRNKKLPREAISTLAEAVKWKIRPESLHKIETVQVSGKSVKGEMEIDAKEKTNDKTKYDLVRPRLIFLLQTWIGFAFKDLCAHKDIRNLIITDLTGKRSIVYYRAKNGELAILPLFPETERLLQALDYNAQPLCSYSTFNRKIKALLKYYVIEQPEETVTHLGRHLFGSRMLANGFSMEAVSRMMGHTSIVQTEKVYARVDLTKVQADYDRIMATQQLGNRIAI